MSRAVRLASLLAAAALATLASLACGGGATRPALHVVAASDLRGAFEEVGALFEERCDCRVVFVFGSSGTLASQIRHGLPADVFASANAAFVDDLQSAGLIAEETRTVYAIGRIVVAVPAASALEPPRPRDLRDERFRRIAIANPEHAPYGLAARQALQADGVWEDLRPRLVLGENASIATEYVSTGNVDAGIIPLSLAIQRPAAFRYELVDASLHEPLVQVMTALRRARNAALAAEFIAYVSSPDGREVMRRHGFTLPEEARGP